MHDFLDDYLLWLGFVAAGIAVWVAMIKLVGIFKKMYPYFWNTFF